MGSVGGLPGPTDAWITLAGLARETKRIRLGTLMAAATFRLPGVLAIQVAQVDQMSGGRVELFHGTYYDLTDSPALPKPARRKIPVLIGGHGASRTPRWKPVARPTTSSAPTLS